MDKIKILTIESWNKEWICVYGEVICDTISARIKISLEKKDSEVFMGDLSLEDTKEVLRNLYILIGAVKRKGRLGKIELFSAEFPHKPQLKIFGEPSYDNILISVEQQGVDKFITFLEIQEAVGLITRLSVLKDEVINLINT